MVDIYRAFTDTEGNNYLSIFHTVNSKPKKNLRHQHKLKLAIVRMKQRAT